MSFQGMNKSTAVSRNTPTAHHLLIGRGRTCTLTGRLIFSVICGCALTCSAIALSAKASDPPAQSQPATQPSSGRPSSLDDLLGIEKEQPTTAPTTNPDAAARDNDEELNRKLKETEAADAFEAAIQKMSLSADLLDNQFDAGLGTQRVQEDIINKLAQLIDQAKKQPSNSKSSSSQSQNQQKSSQSNQPDKKGQQQQQQSDGDKRNNKPSNSREGDPPPLQEGDVNKVLDETRSEWGNLPQRVRDMLLQGRKEKFSNLYDQLTQEYYKRLAEESVP
jgi:hypothetical protein